MEGNQMSNSFDNMHDALVKLKMYMRYETCSKSFCIDSLDLDAFKVIQSALDLPRRNCDVGTAEEQAERFHAFCDGHSSGIGGMCDDNCPCIEGVDGCHCLCKWAQMPYEADAAFTKTGENVNSGSAIDMEVNKPKKGEQNDGK